MPFRSSSTPRKCDKSSLPIDDDIYQRYSNLSIFTLELRKERKDPEHEFLILETSDMDTYYRIERRPSEGMSINDKSRGCKAKDTIALLDDQDYKRVCMHTDHKINLGFPAKTRPDLYTLFAFCLVIRKDPDARIYSLAQFNCYFFARTLTVLIARHFLLRQYCRIHNSPRNDFGTLPVPEVDAIAEQVVNTKSTRERPISFILVDSGVRMILLKL